MHPTPQSSPQTGHDARRAVRRTHRHLTLAALALLGGVIALLVVTSPVVGGSWALGGPRLDTGPNAERSPTLSGEPVAGASSLSVAGGGAVGAADPMGASLADPETVGGGLLPGGPPGDVATVGTGDLPGAAPVGAGSIWSASPRVPGGAVLGGPAPACVGGVPDFGTLAPTPYEVVASYPHDPNAFLQGLVWHDGGFYESTGLRGRSSLRRVAFPSGEVLQYRALPQEYFGEGLALAGEQLVQLTWQAGLGFIYDRASFDLLGTFTYPTEGWGITFDGTSLIMSDGSDRLTFLDPETFQPIHHVSVTLSGCPVQRLNELEWIEGEVWANVWQTDRIVRIDPATGQVVGYLDLTGLLPPEQRTGREDVLNGIAYDAEQARIFVGGKLWPRLFEIRLLGDEGIQVEQ